MKPWWKGLEIMQNKWSWDKEGSVWLKPSTSITYVLGNFKSPYIIPRWEMDKDNSKKPAGSSETEEGMALADAVAGLLLKFD